MADYRIATKITVKIPDGYPPATKKRIGRAIIRRIVERTLSGEDKDGIPFAEYSDSYAKSLEFMQARKTLQVNLRLTNQMLSSIRIIDIGDGLDGTLVIGIDDFSQMAKAYNHIVGDTLPRRDFLGISSEELATILSDFPLPADAEAFEEFAESFIVRSQREKQDITMKKLKESFQKISALKDANDFVSYNKLLKLFGSKAKVRANLEALQNLSKVFVTGDLDFDIKGAYIL